MIEKEMEQTQLKIYERLSQLDEETQERISQKYYHGTRPWSKRVRIRANAAPKIHKKNFRRNKRCTL